MKIRTAFLMSTLFFLLGIILGFLFAPIKKGLYIGNYSGNNNNCSSTKDADEFIDEDAFLDSIPF